MPEHRCVARALFAVRLLTAKIFAVCLYTAN